MTPTHTFLHIPSRHGKGVGLFTSNTFSNLRILKRMNVSFEYTEFNYKHYNQWLLFIVIYRPPRSSVNLFFEEFGAMLDLIAMVSFKVFIVGDFNTWMDVSDNYDAGSFSELLDCYQLSNELYSPTSLLGHMLGLIYHSQSPHLFLVLGLGAGLDSTAHAQ